MLDITTLPPRHSLITNLITLSSIRTFTKLQVQEEWEEVEEEEEMVDTHMEDTATEEDGDSSQEEVVEVTPRMGLATLDSPVPLAARADQEAQEELEEDTVAAEVDQVTLRALELCQNSASDPHPSGTLLSRPS